MMEKTEEYGARIERGVVVASAGEGAYHVASYDRDGITTPGILPLNEDIVYGIGNQVYFFLFPDGTGKIIGLM